MVLWIPDWPIIAAIRGTRTPANAPLALIDRGQVFASSAAARAEGIRRGLRVREAQSRCPDLIVQPYDPQLDFRAFETVIASIEELMPGVQVLRPGMCAVRVRGPARYFGGEKAAGLALVGLIDGLIDWPGISRASVGIADGVFTAEHAARVGGMASGAAGGTVGGAVGRQPRETTRLTIVPGGLSAEFLAPLPVSLLDDPTLVTLLRRLGITTLGEFSALPSDDVRSRFGAGGAHLHALSGGLDSRPVIPHIPPDELDVHVDFEPPLDRVDQVTFGVRVRADEFIQALLAAHLVCTALRIEIDTELGDYSERSWLHPRFFTASDVVDRVRWQLQGSGEVDVGLRSGVSSVRIVPEAVDTIGHHEVGLFGAGPDERIHSGLSRVQSMLGHGGVVTAVITGGRTLADRSSLVPWGDRPVLPRSVAQPWPGQLPLPAPGTVFATPHPVHVFGPAGETIRVDDRGAVSAPLAQFSPAGSGRGLRQITAWAGPWTVDERWWSAETARRVHRFQVVDATGVAWLLVLEEFGVGVGVGGGTGGAAVAGGAGGPGGAGTPGGSDGAGGAGEPSWSAEARYD
jgi:protein ImuB